MDSSIFRISLDVHRQITQTHLGVKKGDTARKIVASLSDGGRPYRIGEGCYAVFKGKKPDGNVLYNSCTIENNCIVYEFTEQTAANAGYMACEFQFYGADGQIITCPRFAVIVSGLVYDDSEVESSGEFTALAQAMTDLADLKANGLKGDDGDSAYEVAIAAGFEGTEEEWLDSLTGPEGPQGPMGETPFWVDVFEASEGWAADVGYDTIVQEYETNRQILCRIELEQQWMELPLVKEFQGVFTFSTVIGGEAWQVVISQMEGGSAAVEVTSTACGREPLHVTLTSGAGGYTVDKTFTEIAEARAQGREVDCRVSTMILPLVGLGQSSALFAAENKEKQYRVTVRADGSVDYDLVAYALEAAATDDLYFDITADGVLSLKPEYRGEVPAAAAGNAKYADAVSNRGADLAGTQNHELPEEIVIPKVVDGITVTAYAYGMFMSNKRIKRLTLPSTVKTIPGHFCYGTWNLRKVSGTEAITTLGTFAFNNSGILDANFPALTVMENKGHFQSCADLVTADLGTAITAIPEGCFFGCEKLTKLRSTGAIKTVGKNGFMNTRRLAAVPFPLSGLTQIGDFGFLVSRINFDWDSLTDCAFGQRATAAALYDEDYWSGCEFTPCSVPLRSTFSQLDPRWVDKPLGRLENQTHGTCSVVAMAMAYSALEGKEISGPEAFTTAVYAANDALQDTDPSNDDAAVTQYMQAVGYDVTHYPVANAAALQAVYDGLAAGGVVLQHCIPGSGTGGHVVLVYGVNSAGELLCADPTSMTANLGRYEAGLYSMVAQNRMRVVDEEDTAYLKNGFWIVRKKEV